MYRNQPVHVVDSSSNMWQALIGGIAQGVAGAEQLLGAIGEDGTVEVVEEVVVGEDGAADPLTVPYVSGSVDEDGRTPAGQRAPRDPLVERCRLKLAEA
jgi:hypothetical protein